MNIIYTQHLKNRLKIRNFPKDYPKNIYISPDEKYKDIEQNSFIAIKKLPYAGKMKKIMIAYIIEGKNVKIKTIYPENDKDINTRVKNLRWIKL